MKEQSAAGILETTIEKVKNLVNVSTIIGEPMNIDGGITIIPVSKVTYGFASGGSDFPSKTNKEIFGGGGGAGRAGVRDGKGVAATGALGRGGGMSSAGGAGGVETVGGGG